MSNNDKHTADRDGTASNKHHSTYDQQQATQSHLSYQK